MELQLRLVGFLLILLAAVHVIFPRYFNWKVELQNISLINRQMMQVHTFFIALTVFLMGLLCASSPNQLVQTELGKFLSLGLAIFWTCRLLIQFFGYSPLLWKGKLFETIIHVIFSLIWTYISLLFWLNYFTPLVTGNVT